MRKKIMIFISVLLAAGIIVSGIGCNVLIDTGPDTDQEFDKLQEVWDIIFEEYVEPENLDSEALEEGAIRGVLEALDDPWSAYLDEESYQLSMSDLQGKFEGIGAYVGLVEEQVVIIAPMPGSPAEEAGILPGDIVLEVDGMPTSEMTFIETILNIRGPKGTPVIVTVQHENETDTVEIEIIRDEIEVASVYHEMLDDIAHIIISSFNERTEDEIFLVLQEITQNGATGIILDLRTNPGGILDTVVNIASRFIDEGVVLYVVDNEGNKTSMSVKPKSLVVDLPLVVLVDEYSASGSEVLAGALQDTGRAAVAGKTTYGKGSVNVLHRLSDGSGIYITIARWQTPSGQLIEGKGVKPDYPLELEGDELIDWAIEFLGDPGN